MSCLTVTFIMDCYYNHNYSVLDVLNFIDTVNDEFLIYSIYVHTYIHTCHVLMFVDLCSPRILVSLMIHIPEDIPLCWIKLDGIITEVDGADPLKMLASSSTSGVGHMTFGILSLLLTSTAWTVITSKII